MPVAVAPVADWQPSPAERAELSPRAVVWLDVTLRQYVLSQLEGLRVMEALRVLTRIERFEGDAMGSAAALVRERRLFLSLWDALRLED
jgi:hypothetical protein